MTKTSLINYIYLYILYIIYISIYNYNWIFVFLFHLPLSFSANRKNILSLCHLSPAKGYEKLKRCVRSAYLFSEEEIRYATRTQLNWTHLRSLMGIKDPLERQFYAQMCSTKYQRDGSEVNPESWTQPKGSNETEF